MKIYDILNLLVTLMLILEYFLHDIILIINDNNYSQNCKFLHLYDETTNTEILVMIMGVCSCGSKLSHQTLAAKVLKL